MERQRPIAEAEATESITTGKAIWKSRRRCRTPWEFELRARSENGMNGSAHLPRPTAGRISAWAAAHWAFQAGGAEPEDGNGWPRPYHLRRSPLERALAIGALARRRLRAMPNHRDPQTS